MKDGKNILILGHGRKYKYDDILCSPIPINKWRTLPYTCVDIIPDIIYDLDKNIQHWRFASDNEYDVIIDTCGILFSSRYKGFFLIQINRILKPNGYFFGRNNFVYCKTSENNRSYK